MLERPVKDRRIGKWSNDYSSLYARFFYNKPDEIPLGFEYEVHTEEKPHKSLPRFYLHAQEGLGGGFGWEYKSPVAPLFVHKRQLPRFFREVEFNTQPNDYELNNGGIHVNVSRNEYTDAASDKVFTFLHQTIKADLLLRLSERAAGPFREFTPQRSPGWYSNYYGVITSRKSYAYELRLFAAQPHLLLPSLEMADSLFSLAHEVESITLENWHNYLKRKLKYAELRKHYESKVCH